MIRTSVYLEESDKQLLQFEAQRRGISEAELIRLGVRKLLGSTEKSKLPSFVGSSSVGGDAGKEKQATRKQWHGHIEQKHR